MTAPHFETIRFERRGASAWIILDRPDAMNSMSPQMVGEIGAALDAAEADKAVRCVVITGTGRAFCAGADLKAVKGLSDAAGESAADDAMIAMKSGDSAGFYRAMKEMFGCMKD